MDIYVYVWYIYIYVLYIYDIYMDIERENERLHILPYKSNNLYVLFYNMLLCIKRIFFHVSNYKRNASLLNSL